MRIGIPHWTKAAAIVATLFGSVACLTGGIAYGAPSEAKPSEVLPPVNVRFANDKIEEEPNFQRHVSPLFGRLGCNGRSCHGSFQGRGDFRLSLFGYDFKADHDELLKGDPQRANAKAPLESLILVKPTDADMHEGGERYKKGGWEYNLFRRWLEAGAKFEEKDVQKLVNLEVTPNEILFQKAGEKVQLKAIAVWPDGTREDVTCISRYQSNSDQVATITTDGLVTATEPGDTHVVISYDNAVIAVPVIRPVSDKYGDKYPKVATTTKIDELVVQKLRKLGVVPSDLCTDSEFIRRVYLDLTGTLPTATETEQFLNDPSSNKRSEKIEQLLNTPAYAAWWTTKLCDFTGNNEQKLNNVGAIRGQAPQQWYDWIYTRVEKNAPYDDIVEGIVLSTSRKPGESYKEFCDEMTALSRKDSDKSYADRPSMPYYWARTGFRTTEERAIGFAYTFLGIRIQCAQCHKHPFDQWAKSDFDAFEPFFGSVTTAQNGSRDKEVQKEYEEILANLGVDKSLRGNDLRRQLLKYVESGKTIPFPEVVATPVRAPNNNRRGKNANQAAASGPKGRVLGGEAVDLAKVKDARQPLMEWLRSKDNPYFAKAFVNRVWASYFNVGIVNPPDDLSLANPPSNKPLLDYLAKGFIDNEFDMKWLHREILNSRTYQLSWQPNETNIKDDRNFARSIPRRLPAEAAYDALIMATASDEKAATFLTNLEGRASKIAASSARAPGGNNNAGYALQVFGRSIRESNCDCDRSMDASLLQTVYLQNDSTVLQAVEGGRGSWIDQISRGSGKQAEGRVDTGDLMQQIAAVKNRLAKAKKDQKMAQAKGLETRLKEMEKKLADAKKAGNKPSAAAGELTIPETEVVRQAYLRTLSRYPTPEEMDRCLAFIDQAESKAAGAKGVLWTLINTKEFIVNH